MIMDNMLVESNKSICDWVLAYWRTLLDNKGEMDSSIAVTVRKSSFVSAIMASYTSIITGFNDPGIKESRHFRFYWFGIDGHGGRIRVTYPIFQILL